ncbi:polysaccharide deacetylase family protein, partial [Vibrio parahaemolyticus]|nr:polysaccharide deacetylase family protein [Vibrio parahaemolyticus]
MNKKYIIKSFMILFLFLFISSTRIEATEGIKPIKVPVLMYHHISDEVNNSMVVSKDKFYEDMITLKEAGYEGIFLTDLYEYLQGNTTLPDKPIIITFDDGYSSFYEIAYPIA